MFSVQYRHSSAPAEPNTCFDPLLTADINVSNVNETIH